MSEFRMSAGYLQKEAGLKWCKQPAAVFTLGLSVTTLVHIKQPRGRITLTHVRHKTSDSIRWHVNEGLAHNC